MTNLGVICHLFGWVRICLRFWKKLVAKKHFTCECVFCRPECWQTRFFCVPPGTIYMYICVYIYICVCKYFKLEKIKLNIYYFKFNVSNHQVNMKPDDWKHETWSSRYLALFFPVWNIYICSVLSLSTLII